MKQLSLRTRWASTIAVASILALGPIARAGDGAQLLPLAGPRTSERLIGTDAAWQLEFRPSAAKAEAARKLSAAEVVSWGAPVELPAGALVVLDEGVMVAEARQLDQESLVVDAPLFGRVSLPLEQVQAIVFRAPAGRRERDQLIDRLLKLAADRRNTTSDRVLLENGDQLLGSARALDDTKLQLHTGTIDSQIERAKIVALVFEPTSSEAPPANGLRALVGFRDGSWFTTRELVIDGETARLKPPFDASAEADRWTVEAQAIVFLQPLGGRATYLSDLKPESYRHIPYLSLQWPYELDRSVTGGRLRADGRIYAKGLGMHSAARLTYRLDKPFRRFEAQVAIDAETSGQGSVTFRVFADREQKFASEVVRGGQPSVPVSVDITGAKQLSLVIDFAERADELDHADWLDARLVE
jgi:hypothetical protein